VPFIVIPDKYLSANTGALPGNNLAAVIWCVVLVR
jgi:chitosanase